VPDSLLGDIFVTIFNRRREEAPKTSVSMSMMEDDEEILLPSRGGTILPTHTSKDLLSFLTEESARFFAFDCQASRTTSSSSTGQSQPVTCDACNASIRKQTHFIRCADCSEPFVDLCVNCFSNGAQFGNHKRNHRYAVVKNKLNNKRIHKINLFEFFKFLINCEEKGSLNYSVFEKQVLGIKRAVDETGASTSAPRAGRSSGRGVRQASDVPAVSTTDDTTKLIAEFNSEAEKTYLGVLSLLTRCSEDDLVSIPSGTVPSDLSGGPGNYNLLRDEFEYEFLPEAETILAAVNPSDSLAGLCEAYNGIQDERERRKKMLVKAHLLNLREFSSGAKKRKTDEKEMFEKVRIFVRPVLSGLESGEKVMKFLDNFATALTTRKRTLDRIKRLLLLHKNGVLYEDSSVVQFDADKKKRHDVNQRRLTGASGTRIWTPLPNLNSDGLGSAGTSVPASPTVRSTRTSGTPLTFEGMNMTAVMSANDAFNLLPGAPTVTDKEALGLCLEFFISPEHWKVVELTIHAVLEIRPNESDENLGRLIANGIIGTTRRFILTAQGLPISGGPGGHMFTFANMEEIKLRIVQTCRESRRRR